MSWGTRDNDKITYMLYVRESGSPEGDSPLAGLGAEPPFGKLFSIISFKVTVANINRSIWVAAS